MSTRNQLRITDIHVSDATLQAAASTAKRATPTVLPEVEIDDDDDDDQYNDIGGQRNKDSLIDNDSGDLRSYISDEDHLDVATENRVMLEMLFENQSQWKTEQRLDRDRMAAEGEWIAAERDQWAAECAESTKRSTVGRRPIIFKIVDPGRFCSGAKELDQVLDVLHSNFNSHGHLIPCGGPNHVKYVISLLDAWMNHQNPTLRPTVMIDPSEWAGDLSADSDPCLQEFDLCSQQVAKVYGKKDRWHVAVITLMLDTYNSRKNRSEPMQIVWKPIGDRMGVINRGMNKSSTILPGQAFATLSKTMLDKWRPPEVDLTPWTNSSIRPWPRRLHMSKTWSHSSSNNSSNNNSSNNNSSRNSLQTRLPKAANEATGHPSLSQPTPLVAANPVNQDQTDTANQAAEDNRQAYCQHHGLQRKILMADILPANAYNADLGTVRRASALNTHEEVTHNGRTWH